MGNTRLPFYTSGFGSFSIDDDTLNNVTNITVVLSKQTTERQERKRCTSVAAKEWRYRLRAGTLTAWLTSHGKWCNWDITQ